MYGPHTLPLLTRGGSKEPFAASILLEKKKNNKNDNGGDERVNRSESEGKSIVEDAPIQFETGKAHTNSRLP